MADYSKFIYPERRSVATPDSLVNPDGTAVFGTFDKEFKQMDLVKLNKPTQAPNCMNKLKLTLWEAVEVNLKDGVLLLAVSDMALFGVTLVLFYDKNERKVHVWSLKQSSKETIIAPNLLNGAECKAYTKSSHARYVNDFQDGLATVEGHAESDEEGKVEFDFKLERVSLPCVVSIPFGKNRPLYSQKDMFKVSGKLVYNGKEYAADANTCAVIDDHRGFYPRHAHYDWVSTMGRSVSGQEKYFGFNLTRNQSIDQDRYNENIIWTEGATSLLTPVVFERSIPTLKYHKLKRKGENPDNVWTVKDEHGMVDLKFHVYDTFGMITHAKPIVNIDYFVAFGELEGYMMGEDGTKYVLDGLMGIGEDKTIML